MSELHEFVIRNGHVIDGSGAPPTMGDVAIDDGLILALGRVDGRGHQCL